tara:strand:- start:1162 stop:1287 length:126 start_codon:yes stop_codon:yes gene_type:complete
MKSGSFAKVATFTTRNAIVQNGHATFRKWLDVIDVDVVANI